MADGRRHVAYLLRRRAACYLALGLLTHVPAGLILRTALGAVGSTTLSAVEFWFIYSTATAAIGLAPTPGGIGFADAGMTLALTRAGVARDTAFPAVLIYRSITLVGPLVSSALLVTGLMFHRKWHRQ